MVFSRLNSIFCHRISPIFLLGSTLLTFSLVFPPSSQARIKDITLRDTISALQNINGATEQDVLQHLTTLDNLNYTQKRIFQALSRLPSAKNSQLDEMILLASRYRVRFNHIPLLEYFVTLPGCSLQLCETLLAQLSDTPFVLERAVSSMTEAGFSSCQGILDALQLITPLEETGLWCARELFLLSTGDETIVLDALRHLAKMTEPQQRAAENYFSGSLKTTTGIPAVLAAITQLPENEANNARALFREKTIAPQDVHDWLTKFFLLPAREREKAITTLSAEKRNSLLHVYNRAATHIIWRINSLHSVTNKTGHEIGTYWLNNMEEEPFIQLFTRLHPAAREQFEKQFYTALKKGNRKEAVNQLKSTTSTARHATAKDLTSCNIYILLANGGELYDSSFRDVLVPALQQKLDRYFHSDLLLFFEQMDEQGEYIADFISNLAQKGKLTDILPAGSGAQIRIVDLVAESALHNENSLILFSATLPHLLQDLRPEARSRLLHHLLNAVESSREIFARQVQAILQYYFRNYPKLLTTDELREIKRIIKTRGEINLADYSMTPFTEWLADNRLRSLSTFPRDDDGWASYVSNCQHLLDSGYKPSLAKDYEIRPISESARKELENIISTIPRAPTKKLSELFRKAGDYAFVVNWTKTYRKTKVVHSVYLYSGRKNQERLLEIFLMNGDEMFAQRGHSYYRKTQLLYPLGTLLRSGRVEDRILQAKQRFISLGSCGGIRAYTNLNEMFRNRVDILGSIGTGTTTINNPYNQKLLEIAATHPTIRSWNEVNQKIGAIFSDRGGQDYIQPGSLPAILHKMRERTSLAPDKIDDGES